MKISQLRIDSVYLLAIISQLNVIYCYGFSAVHTQASHEDED